MLISLIGIPGSGKSTTVKELASLMKIKHYFLEPEEEKWADATKDWETFGGFSMLMWFRSIRIPIFKKFWSSKIFTRSCRKVMWRKKNRPNNF